MANIKYFSFSKASSSVPIYSYCQDKPNEDELKLESTKVLALIFRCSPSSRA